MRFASPLLALFVLVSAAAAAATPGGDEKMLLRRQTKEYFCSVQAKGSGGGDITAARCSTGCTNGRCDDGNNAVTGQCVACSQTTPSSGRVECYECKKCHDDATATCDT